MSHAKKQRTRIEDLSPDGDKLFELSEQMMMMVGGYGSGGSIYIETRAPSYHGTHDGFTLTSHWDVKEDISDDTPVDSGSGYGGELIA